MQRATSKKKLPTGPHQSQLPTLLDDKGHVKTVQEQKQEWRNRGLCPRCGLVQISSRGILWRVPLTIQDKVYKGICLQCHTLPEAKKILGEDTRFNGFTSKQSRGSHCSSEDRAAAESGPTSAGASQSHVRSLDTLGVISRLVLSKSHHQHLGAQNDSTFDGCGGNHPADILCHAGTRFGGLSSQMSEITIDAAFAQDRTYSLSSRGGGLSEHDSPGSKEEIASLSEATSPTEHLDTGIRPKTNTVAEGYPSRHSGKCSLKSRDIDETHYMHSQASDNSEGMNGGSGGFCKTNSESSVVVREIQNCLQTNGSVADKTMSGGFRSTDDKGERTNLYDELNRQKTDSFQQSTCHASFQSSKRSFISQTSSKPGVQESYQKGPPHVHDLQENIDSPNIADPFVRLEAKVRAKINADAEGRSMNQCTIRSSKSRDFDERHHVHFQTSDAANADGGSVGRSNTTSNSTSPLRKKNHNQIQLYGSIAENKLSRISHTSNDTGKRTNLYDEINRQKSDTLQQFKNHADEPSPSATQLSKIIFDSKCGSKPGIQKSIGRLGKNGVEQCHASADCKSMPGVVPETSLPHGRQNIFEEMLNQKLVPPPCPNVSETLKLSHQTIDAIGRDVSDLFKHGISDDLNNDIQNPTSIQAALRCGGTLVENVAFPEHATTSGLRHTTDYESIQCNRAGGYLVNGAPDGTLCGSFGIIAGTMLESESSSALLELRTAGNCDDIIAFLGLNVHSLPPALVILSFDFICEVIHDDIDKTRVSNNVAHYFHKENWAKTLSCVMDTHCENNFVQLGALRTLWVIVSASSCHVVDVISNQEILESIIDAMTAHPSEELDENGSGLLACIALSPDHSFRLLDSCNGRVIERLMRVLCDSIHVGNTKLYALRALFRLSSAFLRSDNTSGHFGDVMGRFVHGTTYVGCPSAHATVSVLDVLDPFVKEPLLQLEGIRLLCQVFTRNVLLCENIFFELVDRILTLIESVLSMNTGSLALHETSIFLISKITSYGVVTDSNQWSLARFVDLVLGIMSTRTQSLTVALHGCRCLHNVCAIEPIAIKARSVVACAGGVDAVIKCLSTFPKHTDVQAEVCSAICAVCYQSPTNKKLAMDLGGIDAIILALNINGQEVTSGNDKKITASIQACVALIALSIDPRAMKMIQTSGIIEKFTVILREEGLPDMLRCKMQYLIDLTLDEDEILLHRFVDSASELVTYECLNTNAKVIMAPNEFDNERAFRLHVYTTASMQKFPSSIGIQEIGCKILSFIYGSSKHVPSNGVEFALKCIREHRSNPTIVASAASTLRNFCLSQPLSKRDSYEYQCVFDALSGAAEELILAAHMYDNDEFVLDQVLPALWAIEVAEKGVVSTFITNETLTLFFGSINTSAKSSEIQRSCLGLLDFFFLSSENPTDFLTDDTIKEIIGCLQSDDEDTIDVVINTILAISKNGLQAVMMIVQNHHEMLIGSIVECMFKFPESPLIIGASCDIFFNISLDNFYRSEVCASGGTCRVNEALKDFEYDESIICKALVSLTNLISGADVEILNSNDVPRNIIQAMKVHEEDLYVQICASSALWHLISRDDMFQEILVKIGAAYYISNAMSLFIASKEMQSIGLVVLWSLSESASLNSEVSIYGIVPVVNGLRAHSLSEKLCMDGLGTLKCMSTVNKQMLDDTDAFGLIFSLMWLHPHNTGIQQSSLAALVNLSFNSEKRQVSRITRDELDAIVNSMREHKTVKAVQENAIFLLRNLTFSPHNCSIIKDNRLLVGLIRSAVAIFNDTFQEKAVYLLQVLPDSEYV